MGRRSTIAFATSLCVLGGQAAADVSYELSVGGGHSDNVLRVAEGAQEESIATAGLNLDWNRDGPRLTAVANVDLDYFHYLDGTTDDEFLGYADADLDFSIVPDHFNWNLRDTFGEAQADPFAAVTPETRENINFFTTGPEFMMRLGTAGALRVFGTWSQTDYEESDIDSERIAGGFSIGRQASAQTRLAFNGVHEEVDYDEPQNIDYTSDTLYLSYDLQAARTDISVDLGYSWLDRPDIDEQSDDPHFQFEISREVSPSSELSLNFGTHLTSTGDQLRSSVDEGAPITGPVQSSADPYENQYASLAWAFGRTRTSLEFDIRWDSYEYETQTQLDRESWTYSVVLQRQMTPRVSAGLAGSLISDDSTNTGVEADNANVGANLSWRFARSAGLRLSYDWYEYDGSTQGKIEESRVFLTVWFRPLPALAAPTGPGRGRRSAL